MQVKHGRKTAYCMWTVMYCSMHKQGDFIAYIRGYIVVPGLRAKF